MRLSRKLKLLCAALVPMLALTACSGGGGQAGADGGEQVKITVWSWDGTVEKAVPGFQAAHPNIKVEVVRMPRECAVVMTSRHCSTVIRPGARRSRSGWSKTSADVPGMVSRPAALSSRRYSATEHFERTAP